MKRHPDLREFSDDHHQGLVYARRLQRAAPAQEGGLIHTAQDFLEFWEEDTRLHFRKEEEVLLPVLARYSEELLNRESVTRMLTQHARIRGLVMELRDELAGGKIRLETLQELGALLEAHIRLEERVVFPLVEKAVSEQALKEIASGLETFGD